MKNTIAVRKILLQALALNLKDQLSEFVNGEDLEIIGLEKETRQGTYLKLSFEGEVLEISHKVSDRSIFANGAIIAGKMA